jgi:mRNA interferase HicA
MNAAELRRWLAKQGCTFERHKGGFGYVTVIFGDRQTQLPMHGSRKELGTRLVNKIKRDPASWRGSDPRITIRDVHNGRLSDFTYAG